MTNEMRAGEDITVRTDSPTASANEVSEGTVTPHSPLPWTVEGQWANDIDGQPIQFAKWIAADDGNQVASHVIDPVDAAFIARACNSHADLLAQRDALLAACREVVCMAVAWQPLTPGDIGMVKAAIAKAEGR